MLMVLSVDSGYGTHQTVTEVPSKDRLRWGIVQLRDTQCSPSSGLPGEIHAFIWTLEFGS
jgi:hypothetical protein